MTSGKYLFEAGVVLYSKLRPYLRKVAVADFRGLCSADMYPLTFDRSRVALDFAKFALLGEEFTAFAVEKSTRARMPKLNRQQLLAYEFPLPPLAEQKRIAQRLTEQLAAVECGRGAAKERLAAAEALPAAYLREAFGEDAPFSASPIVPTKPARPGWRWHLLTEVARLATGHTPSRREPSWWGGYIQWLQLPDIRAVDGRRVIETLEQINELGLANSSAVLLPQGTVCMSRTASVGFVTIMGRAMATSQDFVNWVCGPNLDPDFLMYLILRCRREVLDLGSGATHHSIYFETVQNFNVCLPVVAEQRRIAADLSRRIGEAGLLAAGVREEMATLEALPAAFLREAFTGRASSNGVETR